MAMAGALHTRFFSDDTPHGLVKRTMYKKHLQAFIAVARQARPWPYRVLLVDGFAGKGRYSNEWPTDIEKYGSPVIAVMVALNFFYRQNYNEDIWWNLNDFYAKNDLETIMTRIPYMCMSGGCGGQLLQSLTQSDHISLIFVEENNDNVQDLKTNICAVLVYFLSSMAGTTVDIHSYDTFIHIRTCIVKSIFERYQISCFIFNTNFVQFTTSYWINGCNLVDPWTLCMTFVDPFGYTHTPMKELQAYLGPQRSLLINFMSSYINRFVTRNPEGVARCFGMEDCIELKELFSPDGDAMNDAVANFVAEFVRRCNGDTEQSNNVVNCTDNYEKELRKRAFSELSLTFEMRGKGNAIIYHLVFITNHEMQLRDMKEAMNRATQHSDELMLSDYEILRKGHSLNLGNIQDQERVADAIFQKFSGVQGVDIREIEYFILMDTPYVFRKTPLANMMKEWNPRITAALDKDGYPPVRKYQFPDERNWWTFSFRY